MENLIELANKLQDVFSTISSSDGLDLPQIVVVGSQSSGKSSVLENVVQRDFLPRGSGIVTRRPLVLQLITLKDAAARDYAEFLHIDKRFHDFNEVRGEIEKETTRIAGQNKGISRMPIHLKIYSSKVLNLTVVDLPGLTKIPVGDQPTDIEKQIRSLVVDYISKPNSIILAVTPANQDLVNSDSLKLARQMDPEGKRTLGVLTKLDLMDAGTNALDTLTGRAYPLRLGFVGVVNRSQQDILTNKSMKDALKAEAEFFNHHPAYRRISNRCGTTFLSKQLNTLLLHHIKEKLPEMRSKLSALIHSSEQELLQYGDPTWMAANVPASTLVLRLLTNFATDFVAAIDGTSATISTKQLYGGARIYYIFNNVFGQALEAIAPCSNLSNHDIRTAIRNSTGPRPSLFVPEIAFDLLIKPQIKLLEPPSLKCVELVYEELMKICHSCGSKELQRYPRLHARMAEVVSELLREHLSPTVTYVGSLIAIQRAYINTNHPDFLGAAGAMESLGADSKRKKKMEKKRSSTSTASISPLIKPQQDGLPPNGLSVPRLHDDGHLSVSDDGSQKDSFLNYFFGGASKQDRPALGPQDLISNSQYVPPPSMNNIIEAELERKLDQGTIDGEEMFTPTSNREEIETQLIRSLITSYFNITRKTVRDSVPKAIMHLLVNNCREVVQNRLVTELYKEDLFNELLQEDETMAAERQKCVMMLDIYKKAFSLMNEAM
ncbi:Dynamin-related GTPase protein [Umbelopsis sp. WA50703]